MYCFSQFCRLCVNTNRNLVNIFYIDDDLQTLSEKMRTLLPEIVYDEDNIPNFICDQCCNNVKNLYEFKKRCLKNNEILKLYASKFITMKESPENIELESELKLIQKQISEENTDIDLSLIFIKQEIVAKHEIDPETHHPITVKDEPLENVETDLIKSERNAPVVSSPAPSTTSSSSSSETETEHQEFEEQELIVNKTSVEQTKTYSRKIVIESNLTINNTDNKGNIEPDLKLECTEEDEDSFSEDQGDESMDCDEVISINDSDNDHGDEDLIHIPEPMNLTAKALNNPLLGNLDSPNMCLPPHLASGNRAIEYSWALKHKNRCVYYGCATRINDRKEIPMFKFPWKNKERLEKWINNIGNATLKTFSVEQLANYYLCAKHFECISFRDFQHKRRLNFNAVPVPLLLEDIPYTPVNIESNSSQPIETKIPETEVQDIRPVKIPSYTYSRKRKLDKNSKN